VIPLYSAAAADQGLDLAAVAARVIGSHWYVLGEEVAAFEKEFAGSVGVPHAIGMANGTDALELALRALGVGAGDQVLCAANAGFYTAGAARALGAQPVWVDVDDRTLTLCPAALERALPNVKAKALVATHLYGQLAAVDRIAAICAAAGLPWIEDCAQAHGARIGTRVAGSFADAACFSFYPTKNLGALGDGGAVVTRDSGLAQTLRSLRQYGWGAKYEVVREGGRNSRLDELQAALLRAKLPRLDAQNALRRDIAVRYNAAFADLPLRCPPSTGEDYVAHLYVVRSPRRDVLRAHLRDHGVASDVHYPIPDHRQPVCAGMPVPALPVTEAACDEVLSLPCHPGLSALDAQRVVTAVRSFFRTER
jgi:aminotransferase EvaB